MTNEEIYDLCATEQGATWRKWFAWHPAVITEGEGAGQVVWLTHVERRDFEIGWGCSRHQRRLLSMTPTHLEKGRSL